MEPPIDDANDFNKREEPGTFTQLPEYVYYHNRNAVQQNDKKHDIFGEMDRTTYVIIFVVFILGFFMGKTMQPVILRQV